jgi:hypothetical protein
MEISQANKRATAKVHLFLTTCHGNCHPGNPSPLCQNVEVLCIVVSTFSLVLQEAHLSIVVGHCAGNPCIKPQ